MSFFLWWVLGKLSCYYKLFNQEIFRRIPFPMARLPEASRAPLRQTLLLSPSPERFSFLGSIPSSPRLENSTQNCRFQSYSRISSSPPRAQSGGLNKRTWVNIMGLFFCLKQPMNSKCRRRGFNRTVVGETWEFRYSSQVWVRFWYSNFQYPLRTLY